MIRRDIILYGDINLNIIDGSATWLVSLAETLALTSSQVHVVLKAHVFTDRLLRRLASHPHVTIHPAVSAKDSTAMTLDEAVDRLEEISLAIGASAVIVRGAAAADACGGSPILSKRLWSYVTDFEFPVTAMTPTKLDQMRRISTRSRRVFTQTEESRSYLETIVPEAAGKTLLMTPTVPDDFFVDLSSATKATSPLKLIYSGKLHPEWRTLEMMAIPNAMANAGIPATLTVLGDKFQSADASWVDAMRSALETPDDGTSWLGGLSREEAVGLVAQHDVGLSWRSSALNTSLELSTKVLEYAAAGTPPLLNRTAAHETLLGPDYPLFIDDDHLDAVARTLRNALDSIDQIRNQAQRSARPYSSSATAARLEDYFQRSEAETHSHPVRDHHTKVLLAGHDLKFAGELIELLRNRSDVELRIDHWRALASHDEEASQALLDWADTIICEWAGPNAVWYSSRVRADQRLLVRLHRFELTAPWIANIDIEKVDAVITVSDYYRNLVAETMRWPDGKVVRISNGIDVSDLDRPKHPPSRYSLAIVGIVPILKRPDRTLDLLESLLARDKRFVLHVKGRMPWEYPWIWSKPSEQEPYRDFFSRIGRSPQLTDHIIFEPFGADIGNWLRKIGWVLSPSTLESFHLAPAEGMASGAIPIFWEREGVDDIFGRDFIFPSISQMSDFIMSHIHDDAAWLNAQGRARSIVTEFDTPVVNKQWLNLILGAPKPRFEHDDRESKSGLQTNPDRPSVHPQTTG